VSEDPLVPLLAERSPLLLDAFALRLAAARNPALTAPLASDLGRAAFPAVVLLADVDGRADAAGYALGDLGPTLLPAIRSRYRHAGTFGPYHLYLPRGPALPEPGVARREPTR
jgi:hypothetical protein